MDDLVDGYGVGYSEYNSVNVKYVELLPSWGTQEMKDYGFQVGRMLISKSLHNLKNLLSNYGEVTCNYRGIWQD